MQTFVRVDVVRFAVAASCYDKNALGVMHARTYARTRAVEAKNRKIDRITSNATPSSFLVLVLCHFSLA